MDFGEALAELREGRKVAREGWDGPGKWIALHTPDELSMTAQLYLCIRRPADGAMMPWVVSQTDLSASDWYVVVE